MPSKKLKELLSQHELTEMKSTLSLDEKTTHGVLVPGRQNITLSLQESADKGYLYGIGVDPRFFAFTVSDPVWMGPANTPGIPQLTVINISSIESEAQSAGDDAAGDDEAGSSSELLKLLEEKLANINEAYPKRRLQDEALLNYFINKLSPPASEEGSSEDSNGSGGTTANTLNGGLFYVHATRAVGNGAPDFTHTVYTIGGAKSEELKELPADGELEASETGPYFTPQVRLFVLDFEIDLEKSQFEITEEAIPPEGSTEAPEVFFKRLESSFESRPAVTGSGENLTVESPFTGKVRLVYEISNFTNEPQTGQVTVKWGCNKPKYFRFTAINGGVGKVTSPFADE